MNTFNWGDYIIFNYINFIFIISLIDVLINHVKSINYILQSAYNPMF
jgi:hypothetical protein